MDTTAQEDIASDPPPIIDQSDIAPPVVAAPTSTAAQRMASDPKFFLATSSSLQIKEDNSNTNTDSHLQNQLNNIQEQAGEGKGEGEGDALMNTSQTELANTSIVNSTKPLPPSSPNLATRAAANSSGLFVDDSDEEDTEIDNHYTLFESQIQAIIPEIGLDEVAKLYEKFKIHENQDQAVMMAVNCYYDSATSAPGPLAVSSSSPVKRTQQHVSYAATQLRAQSSSSSSSSLRRRQSSLQFRDPRLSDPLDPQLSSSSSARKRQKTEVTIKPLSQNIHWRRFIGQLQISAWATRPTIKALAYGTQLTIMKTEVSQQNSRGRRAIMGSSVSSYLKLVQDAHDASKKREIGRMPEDVAAILYPLINEEIVDFDVTVVFCDGRLSTGDSFFVQIDCYLTSNIFKTKEEKRAVSGAEELKLMRQGSGNFDKHSTTETAEEKDVRRRQVALLRLFNKLDFIVQESDINSEEGLDDNNGDDAEIIDLSDDEQVANLSQKPQSQQKNSEEPTDEMNLNQLKEFYKRTQTEKILASLPETTPPPEKFQIDLRSYQKQGLTWMLRNERELDQDPEQSDLMNPLWKEFKFPKDRSWPVTQNELLRQNFPDSVFYANLYSGEFSLEKPVLRSIVRGGILADEMGLGKTISTLSLIYYASQDSSVDSIEQAQKTNYAYKTTLIVVPTSLLQQWQDEFDKCNADGSTFFVYYGTETNSTSMPELLLAEDAPTVVFTTYGTVQTEWQRYMKSPGSHVGLYSVKWFRIVLDEGHNIRNRMNKTTKAAYDLKVSRKWLLTGTPIINRLDDLYSLVKFLELEPWSHISYWNTFITTPFLKKDYKQALDVVASILDPILLRRTKNMKKDGRPLVELPSKQVIIERIQFNPQEQNLYNWFLKLAETSVSQGIRRGDILKKYTQILVHILRLRQICCHMDLVKGSGDEMDEDLGKVQISDLEIPEELLDPKIETFTKEELETVKLEIKEKFPSLDDLECSICTTQPIVKDHISFTSCCHTFCHSCILEHYQYQQLHGSKPILCPNCRTPISSAKFLQPRFSQFSKYYELYPYDSNLRSSKLNALLTHIRVIKDTTPRAKIVVFSQFSSYLDIMERVISLENGVKVLKFHGKLSMEKRSSVLQDFKAPRNEITVLLLSLKAGGVGLNLTEANTAFMCDPWWSPSVEDQAIDRIHRIGQENDVKVIRFIMQGSIEEKMLKIQERKRTIGEAVEAEEEERRKRRVEEIQMLFE